MEVLLRKEFWELLKRLVGALSRWEREVFLLRYLDHMPIKDIAAVLNKSDSTIKTHLYRALTKVKNDPVFLSICEGA
jgi:RNA polymerase sigma-70 factor (ECF subfamily)